MFERRFDVSQSGKIWILLVGFGVIVYALWRLSHSIAGGSTSMAVLLAGSIVAFLVAGRIANDWRRGIPLFFVWLIFEDLARKYTGNAMYVYFTKDVLLIMTYISLFASGVSRDLKFFRPPFRYALSTFILLGLVQAFNPYSPSFYYSILGIKLHFFYIPLMFVGYSMLRGIEDLRRFLVLSAVVGAVVSLVGIIQTVVGLDFLNPRTGGDLDELGHLVRYTPSGLAVIRPPSIFVSDGRFATFMMLTFILCLGTAGFLLLRSGRGRMLVFPSLGVIGLAAALTGSRAAFLYCLASALVLPLGMIWGAPKQFGQGYRLVKAIRRSFIFVGVAMALAVMMFPEVFASHMAFYHETLTPGSGGFEAGRRTWDYPVEQLLSTLADPHWVTGRGIGTASLGMQYVSRIMGVPYPGMGVENGYGVLIQEFGILGPIFFLIWTISLFASACRVMFRLRGTWAFPVGFSIVWFTFILLFAETWTGLDHYQNFITNAYFWLLTGFLFRLPSLVAEEQAQAQQESSELAVAGATTPVAVQP